MNGRYRGIGIVENAGSYGGIRIAVALIICFTMVSCANPFGRGTWTPLPFKKMQKPKTALTSPADTTKVKMNK